MISIIIPVYRVEPYIKKCIDSIIEQQYGDLNIVLVNDNTDDGSMVVCSEIAVRDERFQLINLKNHVGVGTARNIALEYATGDSVLFLDPDDYLCPGAIKKIASHMHNGVDLIRSECVILKDNDIIGRWNYQKMNGEFEKINMYSCYTYSRRFLEKNNIRFPALNVAEDQVFLLKVMSLHPVCIDIDEPSFSYCKYSKRFNRCRYTAAMAKEHVKAEEEMLSIIMDRSAFSFTNAVICSIERMIEGAYYWIAHMDLAELVEYKGELIMLQNRLEVFLKKKEITLEIIQRVNRLIKETEKLIKEQVL